MKNLEEDLKEIKGEVTEDLRLIHTDLGGIRQVHPHRFVFDAHLVHAVVCKRHR